MTSLNKALQTDVSYKITKNWPIISKQLIQVSANPSGAITTPAGKEVLINLPRYGILSNIMFQSTLVSAGTNNGFITSGTYGSYGVAAGLAVFSLIELRSHNRVIVSNTDSYIRVRTENSGFSKGLSVLKRAKLFSTDGQTLVTSWVNASVITYTPFYCPFFEDPVNYLDLSFVEQLQMRCIYNTQFGMGLQDPLTSATTTMWMWYYNMAIDSLMKLQAKNFNPSVPLTMLGYESFVETGPIGTTGSPTSLTINLQCKNAVTTTYVYLRYNNAEDDGSFSPQKYYPVTSYTVKMGGKTLYDTVPVNIGTYESDMQAGSGQVAFDGTTLATAPVVVGTSVQCIKIPWNMENNKHTFNSGCVSLYNIANPQIILNFAAVSYSTVDYYVVHEYHTLLTIDANTGRLELSGSV